MNADIMLCAMDHLDQKLLDAYFVMEENWERKKKRRFRHRLVASAAAFLLVCSAIFSVLKSVCFPVDPDDVLWWESFEEAGGAEVRLDSVWNGKLCSYELTELIHEANEADMLGLAIWRSQEDEGFDSFVYQGMTFEEMQRERRQLSEQHRKLGLLLREGNYLKYGEKLYTEGAPDGKKYTRELYEERLAYYGSELLEQYLADGIFYEEKAEQERQFLSERLTDLYRLLEEWQEIYAKSRWDEYRNILKSRGYSTVCKNGFLFLFVTKAEFAEMDLEGMEDARFVPALRRAYEDVHAPKLDDRVTGFAYDKIEVGGQKPASDGEVIFAVQELMGQNLYTHDALLFRFYTKEPLELSVFDGMNAFESISVTDVSFLGDIFYGVLVRYEDINMRAVRDLSRRDDISKISISVNASAFSQDAR